jgi:paired amphipathic helix protein Sin3a
MSQERTSIVRTFKEYGSYISENPGFICHKKSIYEEALHQSEEQHEYNFHIEAIVMMLNPVNKVAQPSPEKRGVFKLKPNLGSSGKSIHHHIGKLHCTE